MPFSGLTETVSVIVKTDSIPFCLQEVKTKQGKRLWIFMVLFVLLLLLFYSRAPIFFSDFAFPRHFLRKKITPFPPTEGVNCNISYRYGSYIQELCKE